MSRLKTWFKGLTATGKVTTIAVASIISLGTISAMAQPSTPSSTATPVISTPKPQPKVETKTVDTTEIVGYTSSTVDDPNFAQGTTQTRTVGVNGVRTFTHELTLTNGIETARKEVSNVITTQPVNEVLARGTKVPEPPRAVQLSCPNGTYVNTAGNTVCRPYESSGVPAGASAQCEDGTYSFSQSRRGTCSGHGGVTVWL